MSIPEQPTAEKSVQTHDTSGPTTLLLSNNPVTHSHTENTATEVANTLVSMATGRQRGTSVKQLVCEKAKLFQIFFTFYLYSFKECH